MSAEHLGVAQQLNGWLMWLVLPIAAYTSFIGAIREDMPMRWSRLMGTATTLVLAVMVLRLVRLGLQHPDPPKFVWLMSPLITTIILVTLKGSAGKVLAMLAWAVSICFAAVVALEWLIGVRGVTIVHDIGLLLAVLLLPPAIWKQLRTPRPPEPMPPTPPPPPVPSPTPAQPLPTVTPETELDRQARLKQRLSSAEAQEAADKDTRE